MHHSRGRVVSKQAITMNENHRRGISTTLRLFDAMLCRFEEWARGREVHSVFHHEKNGLTPGQRRELLEEIAALKDLLRRFRDELDLTPGLESAANDIWGGCSGFWENLVELESRHLRRYGDVPPALARYMDANVPQLITGLERILAVLGPRESRKPGGAYRPPRSTAASPPAAPAAGGEPETSGKKP